MARLTAFFDLTPSRYARKLPFQPIFFPFSIGVSVTVHVLCTRSTIVHFLLRRSNTRRSAAVPQKLAGILRKNTCDAAVGHPVRSASINREPIYDVRLSLNEGSQLGYSTGPRGGIPGFSSPPCVALSATSSC